jgi:hypothetical protein
MANSNYQILSLQKYLIEKRYNCFKCSINSNREKMVCKGQLQPLDGIETYQIEIIQSPGFAPKVFIIKPNIEYNSEIHMYKKGNLCLFYPPDLTWKANTSVADYIIPWINEWIIYYELYRISGEWEGPSAPHGVIE